MLQLTYPEDINRPENLPAVMEFLRMFIPDEQWTITRNQDCTIEAECDTLTITITTSIPEE